MTIERLLCLCKNYQIKIRKALFHQKIESSFSYIIPEILV